MKPRVTIQVGERIYHVTPAVKEQVLALVSPFQSASEPAKTEQPAPSVSKKGGGK